MNSNPLNVGRITISKEGCKLLGVVVETSFETGILRQLGELAEKYGITIPYIQVSMPKPGDETAKSFAFIEISTSKLSPKEILKVLKEQEFVKSAEIIEPSEHGIIGDTYYFPLVVDDERVVMFRKDIYAGIFKGIRSRFGTAGEAFLYYQGFEVGERAYLDYVKFTGTDNLKAIIEAAKIFNRTLGWSIVKEVYVDEKAKKAIVKLYENFECDLGRGGNKPFSQFYRGAIAGIFTAYFGEKMEAKETKCIAKGDPYCEFEVSRET